MADVVSDAAAGEAGADEGTGLLASLLAVMTSSAFMGGLWLALIGALSGAVVLAVRKVADLISRYFIVRASVANTEEAFNWVVLWLASQKNLLSSQKLKLEMKRGEETGERRVGEKQKVQLLPGSGFHLFPFKGKIIWMQRVSGKRMTTGWEQTPFQFESLHLSTFSRSKEVFLDLFDTAQKYAESLNNDKTRIFTLASGGYRWICAMAKPPRPLESVILDTNLSDMILKDCEDFFSRKEWYENRGIPYRRGYLLYGPAGTGKTSFTQSLAGRMNCPICVLTLSSNRLSDAALNSRLHETPERAIILLEDVDAIFVKRESTNSRSQGVTFSGLLNALDGVASQENRLLFMTTNHIEKLDPALIRPGRCDVHVKFDYASPAQMRGLFSKFFPDESDAADLFSQQLAGTDLSMAALQGYLMKRRDNMAQALEQTAQLRAQEAARIKTSDSMDIGQWLTRLGLEQYYEGFARAKVFTVSDMPRNIEALGVKVLGHRKRIAAMQEGRADVMAQFAFAAPAQAEAAFLQYFHAGGASSLSAARGAAVGEADLARRFADAIPEHTVSVAQVMKHCAAFRDDPVAAAAPENVAKLVAKCRRKFGRGVEGNIAMSLLSTGDAEAYDAMEVGTWLTRLGLGHLAVGVKAQLLNTVGDLRKEKGNLSGVGISDERDQQKVKDMLEGDSKAVAAFALVTNPTSAADIFKSTFPDADPATAAAWGKSAPRRDKAVSVACMQRFLRHHRAYNELGQASVDATGKRALTAAPHLGSPATRPAEMVRVAPLLTRLGLYHLYPLFAKQGVYEVQQLRLGTAWMDAQTLMDMFMITVVGDRVLLSAALKGEAGALSLFAKAITSEQVTAAVTSVYPKATAEVLTGFLDAVRGGRASVAQILHHCRRHSAACASEETKGDSDSKGDDGEDGGEGAVARDNTGDAALAAVSDMINPAAAAARSAKAKADAAKAKAATSSKTGGAKENSSGLGASSEAESKATGEGEGKGGDSDSDSDDEIELRPWLADLGLSEYAPQLLEEGFDDAALLADVTDEELADVGVATMGARARILQAAAKFKQA